MNGPPLPASLDALLAHRNWVRRVARALTADEHLAADLEQDLWVEALERPPNVRTSVRAWAAAVLRHDLLDRRRSAARRARREEIAARPEAIPSDADVVADADAHRRVVNAVMDLAEPYRATVLLRWYEDLGPSAIAARQGIPVETVRTRLRRAVHLLRERLDAQSGGNRSAWMAALLPLARNGLAPSAAASGSVAGWIAGGLLMKATTKVALAALVLLLGGLAGWEVAEQRNPPRRAPDQATASRERPIAETTGTVVASAEQTSDGSTAVARPWSPPREDAAGTADANRGDAAGPSRKDARGGASAPIAPAAVAVVHPDLPDGPAGPGEVVGRVLAMPGRTPVGGAVVEFIGSSSGGGPKGPSSVTTGGNGVFRLKLAPGRYNMKASLEGHLPREFFVSMPSTGGVDRVEVLFGGGATVEGRVLGPDGPVAGAELTLNAGVMFFSNPTSQTDADGRYRFEDVPAGARIDVTARVGDVWRSLHANLVAGGTAHLDFDVSRTSEQAALAGRVTDRGSAVVGASLMASNAASSGTATTGSDGGFRFTGLGIGDTRITLTCYDVASYRRDTVHVQTLPLVPGENRLEVRLGEGDLVGEVSGRALRKSTGTPIDMVQLTLYVLEEKAEGAWTVGDQVATAECARLGAPGSYRVRGLRPGRYRMIASGNGRIDVAPTTIDFELAYGERKTGFDVALDPAKPRDESGFAATLAGRVTDAGDAPVSRAGIYAYEVDSGRVAIATGDVSGGYSLNGLLPGRWLIHVAPSGWDWEAEVAETTIAAGPNALDLRLGAGEIAGRVHARIGGRALRGPDVWLTASVVQRDGGVRYVGTARPQPDGAFRFARLRDGPVRVVAWPRVPGLRPAAADVEVVAGRPGSDLDLALDDGETGTVVLVVRDDAAAEAPRIVVESLVDGHPVQGSRLTANSLTGTYALPVAAGPWSFSLWTPDGRLAGTASGEVRVGATMRADVALRPRIAAPTENR